MEKIEVEVFSMAVNAAVVRIPGRAFPGMVIQGDTLHRILRDVDEIQEMAAECGKPDLEYAISSLRDDLKERMDIYEVSLKKQGLGLPY